MEQIIALQAYIYNPKPTWWNLTTTTKCKHENVLLTCFNDMYLKWYVKQVHARYMTEDDIKEICWMTNMKKLNNREQDLELRTHKSWNQAANCLYVHAKTK